MPRAENFFPSSSTGWCISIRSKKTQRKSGRSIASTRTDPVACDRRGSLFAIRCRENRSPGEKRIANDEQRYLLCRSSIHIIRLIMKTAPLFLLFSLVLPCFAQNPMSSKEVDAVYPAAHSLYIDLHQSPELSSHEIQTASKLAARLRSLGYEVTEGVGGTGVVAILKNGAGPPVMLRTELDALPVEEKTGLPYASKVHAKDDAGHDVPVMHACGHDLHMAAILGTAEIMARSKDGWHGTLMLIGQPAEETISGAEGMIRDGLFQRFPRPDVALALHVGNTLPAGAAAIT